jgi:subtilisin family serine protease
MRKSLVAASAAVVVAVAMASPAAAATPGALTPAQASAACAAYFGVAPGPEPLSACQWDMRRMDVGAASYAKATGAGVTVGVMDSGVDFTHPDLAGAIDVGRSCSFIDDDTPTADPGDIGNGDCSDKAAVQDFQGHGTHVATTIAGRLNDVGIAGVAPNARVVALKACTTPGYCFADSVAAALRYAGDQRLDVLVMGWYVDPYLYYCKSEAQQRAILKKLQDASRYAQQRGVVLVASAGDDKQDLGHPVSDSRSPDYPPGSAVERDINNSCRMAPPELPGVVTVSGSGVKQLSGFSSAGRPVDVTAPGGDAVQTDGRNEGRVLAGWTSTDTTGEWELLAAVGRGVEDAAGNRWVWNSGAAMAAAHVAGVAALLRERHPGWSPGAVAAAIRRSATPTACPTDWPADDERHCRGGAARTSFYGAGMANALAPVAH